MNEALQATLRGELASSAAFPTGDTRHGIGDAGRLRALDASSPSPAASARADDGLHDFVTGETQISNKTTARSVSVDVAVRATRNRRLGGLVLLLVVLGAMGMALLLVRHNATDAPLEQPSDSSPTLAAPPRAEASLPASPPPQANVPAPWASQLGPAE